MKKTTRIMSVLALALGLGVGCSHKDEDRAEYKVDKAADRVHDTYDETKADVKAGADKADQKWDETKADVKAGADRAADKADQKWEQAKAGVNGAVRDDDDDDDTTAHAADNTGVNERDRNDHAKTADSADMTGSDVDIMAKIRKAVVDDDSLSTNAHNVKIIADDGVVTLKGPVASATEKAKIEDLAIGVVGRKNVRNLIDVAP